MKSAESFQYLRNHFNLPAFQGWNGKEYFFLPILGLLLLHFLLQNEKPENVMEQRITMITLGVENIQRSKDFYSQVFGWNPSDESNENIVFYKVNGIFLSLFDRESLAEDARIHPSQPQAHSFTISYNTRSREEVDEILNAMKLKNVKIVKEAGEVFWGGYHGYISDPDGYLWEIAYNPYLSLDTFGNIK
ncbi:MAG TPA: VOC family protein [Saprospiraceae bacterium]|nr:VOC family protein [Saprospiraceae bacterium]